jgi:transcriptional regulator with XRE-family HTH domain
MLMYTPERIRELRSRLGLTLEAFGGLFGVTKSTVCYWESGERHPRYGVLIKLNQLAEEIDGKKAVPA